MPVPSDLPTRPLARRRTSITLLVLLLALSVVAAACSSGSGSGGTGTDPSTPSGPSATGPREGGTLTVAVASDPASWSPAGEAWDTAQLQAARAVYDRLLSRDVDDVPVPELATAVEPNADFTQWTITLRRGVTFHDGTPLDAPAVAANLEAQRTSAHAYALLAPVEAVRVVGADTVVVATDSPWSTFPQVLTTQVGYIAAPSVLSGASATPVGTGPFTFGGQEAGTVELTRNEGYWRAGLPHLDAVRLVTIPEAADRVDAVLDGTVDVAAVDEPRQVARLDEAVDGRPVTVLEDRNGERPKVNLAFDTGRPPFDHITARRAVGLATDREEILEKVFDGEGTVSRGMLSDASPWFSDNAPPSRDLDRARRQVELYTDENGQPITFQLLVPPDPTLTRVASVWRLQLAEAGIDVELVPVAVGDLLVATLTGQYQAALTVGFSDPHPDLYEPLFRGIPAEQPAINTNITRYVNPVVTKAFADARQTGDVARQVDDYRIVQEQVAVDTPYLFLIQVRSVVMVNDRLRDITTWVSGAGPTSLSDQAVTVSLAELWFAP